MGANSATPDRRLRIHAARFCQDVARPGLVRGNFARAGSARATPHGMGQHTDELLGGLAVLVGAYMTFASVLMGNTVNVYLITDLPKLRASSGYGDKLDRTESVRQVHREDRHQQIHPVQSLVLPLLVRM
jgi:hypothetical protein